MVNVNKSEITGSNGKKDDAVKSRGLWDTESIRSEFPLCSQHCNPLFVFLKLSPKLSNVLSLCVSVLPGIEVEQFLPLLLPVFPLQSFLVGCLAVRTGLAPSHAPCDLHPTLLILLLLLLRFFLLLF